MTAIATDPQRNVDFYHAVLGLRLVKATVNFDAPDTYHLYFGGEVGWPGTLITFFTWPGTPLGRRGAGQATTVSFSVPEASLGWWQEHLRASAVTAGTVATRSSEETLSVRDSDGLALELIAHPQSEAPPAWPDGPVPAEHAIHTAELLTGTLGFRLVEQASGRFRLTTGDGGAEGLVDVVRSPEVPQGLVAAGTVHHIAWRTPSDDEQIAWRTTLVEQGLNVTPILTPQYFQSIYFRESGGVRLEIATDPTGFTIDEPLTRLGQALNLPPWLEPSRTEIEQSLPVLKVPGPDEEISSAARGIEPEVRPSGSGCVDCLAGDEPGWWFHLRRCAQCGHIGCCDSSPSQHATGHSHTARHRILASFEPGESWFYDTNTGHAFHGHALAELTAHPADQPVPDPAGKVPADWQI